jgi:hypothetical protein
MNHWALVGQDVWWLARWVLPPCLFIAAGISIDMEHPSGVAFFVAGVIFYIMAMNGWWI